MKKFSLFAVAVAGFVAVAAGSASAADVKAGAKVFRKCKACHALAAGKNKLGPSLHGVFGRTAGTTKKFKYSKAMKAAGAKGLVWNEETMSKYLEKPKKFVPKTRMAFPGLKKKKDVENVIAYLKGATK